jgi:hypothetical protein
MPLYRVVFAREWTMGRWGFLDRFFHDLGGREGDSSKLDNSWVVHYRGNARRLGRELAMALNIQEADYRKFGPIFEIEELAESKGAAERAAEEGPSPPKTEPTGRESPPTSAASAPDPTPAGPTWAREAEVEDVAIASPAGGPAMENRGEAGNDTESGPRRGTLSAEWVSATRARREDLFRIRTQSGSPARDRADAITSANRRKPLV